MCGILRRRGGDIRGNTIHDRVSQSGSHLDVFVFLVAIIVPLVLNDILGFPNGLEAMAEDRVNCDSGHRRTGTRPVFVVDSV